MYEKGEETLKNSSYTVKRYYCLLLGHILSVEIKKREMTERLIASHTRHFPFSGTVTDIRHISIFPPLSQKVTGVILAARLAEIALLLG